ncbi:hypothetical protein [Actinoplanes sp. N902-109]|uniref:hypothetical protein n=1 Tax=Actinoplanes sp. (strain N902-109) TaxID=649831 RepID=UPI0003294D0A|nr:hypothetical protein [Actinoplanes sp. N902-109]AGL13954.1 hypothetical protein L083_0444 [Actinoplanes sp. N902-109]
MFFRTVAAALLTTAAVSGCASPAASPTAEPAPGTATTTVQSAQPGPARSIPVRPIPSGVPKTPTDILQSPGWTEGYIVRGGSGPCYGLLDMDGFPYAMYSDAGQTLTKGDHVRVRVTPSKLRIDCGEGTPMQMTAVQHVS